MHTRPDFAGLAPVAVFTALSQILLGPIWPQNHAGRTPRMRKKANSGLDLCTKRTLPGNVASPHRRVFDV
jgi:hypothetical protein